MIVGGYRELRIDLMEVDMELPRGVEEFAEFFSGEGLTEDQKLDKLGWIVGLVRKQGEGNEEFKRRIDGWTTSTV